MITRSLASTKPVRLATLVVLVLSLALALASWTKPAFAEDGTSTTSATSATSATSTTSTTSTTSATSMEEVASTQATTSTQGTTSEQDMATIPELPETAPLSASEVLIPMGNDVLWFGESMELGGRTVNNDLIGAGRSILITGVTTGGSFRIAGQNIAIRNCVANENMTVAGQDVIVEGSQANAVALAGQAVTFSGSCHELTAYASTVIIDGTVEGDVTVGAETVEIRENARIKGTLRVEASSDPVMYRGSEVADVEYTQVEETPSSADISSAATSLFTGLAIIMMVVGILGTLLVAVLSEWLFARHTAGAAEMVRTRTGATIGSGVIGLLVLPMAIIIALFLVVTWPVAGVLFFTLLAMSSVASGFMGASIFKLAFPNLGRFKCALAGGAIIGVASAVPIVGYLVSAASIVYLLGYVLQSIYLGMRAQKAGAVPAPALDAPRPEGPVPPQA